MRVRQVDALAGGWGRRPGDRRVAAGPAGGRSGGSGPLAPRLSYTAGWRDSPNTQGTIGTFLTYEEAVAAARDYVLRW
jgi:hypothetical protein